MKNQECEYILPPPKPIYKTGSLYFLKKINDKYYEIETLPRWAYHDDEWKSIISDADKIVNGIMYIFKQNQEEQDVNDLLEI